MSEPHPAPPSQLKKKKKNNNNRRRWNKNKRKPSSRPLFLEVQKLVRNIKPITVNGQVVDELETPLDEHLKSLLEDKNNKEDVYLSFLIHPSDPDFPYDLEFLNVTLSIPQNYPYKAPNPSIIVLNDDIPKGFSANIEIGFRQIVATALHNRNKRKNQNGNAKETQQQPQSDESEIEMAGGNDLLGMMKTLDKYLEKFLSMKERETVKIVKVIKKYDQEAKAKEERSKEQEKQRQKSERHKQQMSAEDREAFTKRNEEIERFKQRIGKSHLRLFKDSPQNTTFKLDLQFWDGSFTIEIEEASEIELAKLPVKLTIPKEYMSSSSKKPLKLELDMSNQDNLKMLKSVEDQAVRLALGKLINNMSLNFTQFASAVVKSSTEWTITGQLNFFVENIQKFMNLPGDFLRWYDDNEQLKAVLMQA